MKKLFRICITFFIVLFVFGELFGQSPEREELQVVKLDLKVFFERKDFEKASKPAKRQLELCIQLHGEASIETAFAYQDLGIVLRELGKYKESAEYLQLAVTILRRFSDHSPRELLSALQLLALSHRLTGAGDEAEKAYQLAEELTLTVFGSGSKESYRAYLNLANALARNKKFERADDLYLQAYKLAFKLFDNDRDSFTEIDRIDQDRLCLGTADSRKYRGIPDFLTLRKQAFELPNYPGIAAALQSDMVFPKIERQARQPKPVGAAFVRVLVGIDGRVERAEYLCGPAGVEQAVLRAARNTLFINPTVNGAPIKFKGAMPYNFVQ